MPRDYTPVLNRLNPGMDRDSAMRAVSDALWDEFGPAPSNRSSAPGGLAATIRGELQPNQSPPISWVGFYTWSRATPDEMTLGPRRDKPACSPIGLHGACGQCLTSRKLLVVTDVANLGEGYIACDPRDRSEVVIPCLNPDGSAWGVLDIDSHAAGAFDEFDALTLARLLRHVGLTALASDSLDDVRVV